MVDPNPCHRCCQAIDNTNLVERSGLVTIKDSTSWFGTTVSVMCAFVSSYFQQLVPGASFLKLMTKPSCSEQLEHRCTRYAYPMIIWSPDLCLTLVAPVDHGQYESSKQLCHNTGIVIG